MSSYEITGVVFGLACVWLAAKQSIWNWPLGIIGAYAFIVTFYQSKLYPDTCLHIIYLIMGIYGWAKWSMGSTNWKEPPAKLPVTRIQRREMSQWILIILTGSVILGYFFSKHTQTEAPFIDSTITMISLVANYLLCRKILENWILWIITDVIAISLYTYKGLYLTSGLYAIYLLICINGYTSWKKELQQA